MKSKEISNLFFNNGLCLAPDSNDLNSIESINTEEIIFFLKNLDVYYLEVLILNRKLI